ncbi:MAG: hypothetical protein QOF69_2799 [Solirubrobacteraceae bacterium]|nr:hypothetical protein [Solirubrobacteraceae bacterium]MEA2183614.1 hypothetical protein [Solirubrobacteraceae bacterium]
MVATHAVERRRAVVARTCVDRRPLPARGRGAIRYLRCEMRRVLVLCFAVATTPATASAATLTTDTGCYQETGEVVLSGAGYTPLTTVSVARDSKPLGTAETDANGAFQRKFETPELPRNAREKLYELSATDPLNVAYTRYRATKVFADFVPPTGNPKTLKVRFSVNGFGLVSRRPSVFLHYVGPRGKARRTVRLGMATGVCGLIRQTRERHLFPFDPQRGNWILQFDTNRTYVRGTGRSRFPWVRKPVEVFSSRS